MTAEQSGSSVSQNRQTLRSRRLAWGLRAETAGLPELSPEVTEWLTNGGCLRIQVKPFNNAGPSPSICSDDDSDDDSDDLKQWDHVECLLLKENSVIATSRIKCSKATSESTPVSPRCSSVPQNSNVSRSRKRAWGVPEESPELSGESTNSSAWLSEKTTNQIITDLVMRLTENTPQNSWQFSQMEDIDLIVQRLSDMARDNIHIDDSALKRTWKNTKNVNKAVIEDLKKEFGSAEQLLEAAVASNTSSFDEAVLKYLKIHLDALHRPGRSAAANFFSRVGINNQTL